ncbi:MAG: hypothetical protein ACRD30_07000 [Bryobacteraceae bacterium]
MAATVLVAGGLSAQAVPDSWRRVGNSVVDRSLADLATGPVVRVWYTASGSLMTQSVSGRVFQTADFETWQAIDAAPPANQDQFTPIRLPEADAVVKSRPGSSTAYAVGKFAWRSDDGGASWDNLTDFQGFSILGGDLRDLAISPSSDDQVVVAGTDGVFRSMDGGKSWSGLNQGLPNLRAARLLSLPAGDEGVKLALADGNSVEWEPGQKRAWTPDENTGLAGELEQRRIYSARLGADVTAIAVSSDYIFVGMNDGRITVSADRGATWRNQVFSDAGAVERFWVNADDPRIALAALAGTAGARVVRTEDGAQWDDLTGNLPETAVHGITADRGSGAIYTATDSGVFMAYTNFNVLGTPPQWTSLPRPAPGAVMDVKLDGQGNQLWAAVDGFGVYATLAPHRARDPRVVSTADLIARAAAPGSLVSVLGLRVNAARADGLAVPVLTASDAESQLQIPFEARGSSLSLAIDSPNGPVTLPPVSLASAAPAIFNRDGSPMLLDADTGVMLDAMNPAHSRGRIQILATGLGSVRPDWPTGVPGPLDNPPEVAAAVHAYLDREPVEVTRAVLAPYIGFYLVEIEVPKIVNYGPEELYIEVNGQQSNRVRVYIEP